MLCDPDSNRDFIVCYFVLPTIGGIPSHIPMNIVLKMIKLPFIWKVLGIGKKNPIFTKKYKTK